MSLLKIINMRNCLLILLLGTSLLNCSNNDDNTFKSQLIGNWKWVESSGGINGRTETPESTGNNIKLEISKNSIKKFVNESLESESNYTIEIQNHHGETHEIIFYDEYSITQTISLNENYLILYDNCADCFQNEYIRE